MSNQSENVWACQGGGCDEYEEDAVSVYGYTGTLHANSQVELRSEPVARQADREENAASGYGYTYE